MIQEDLRKKSQELLESGSVNVVIGYGKGSGENIRPVFIRKPDAVDRLIFDERCVQNLAVYLLKHEVKELGKLAVIASLPVMRAINQLMFENQIADGEITVIGISEEGTILELPDVQSMRTYLSRMTHELTQDEKEKLEQIEKLSPAERWNFWQDELEVCMKCYACRASCPLCYCSRCTVEGNQPQWISVPSHRIGNLEWHIMRAMHLAGRCVNCGECYRACPLKIPINLLTWKLAEVIEEKFGVGAGIGEMPEYPLSMFKPDDKEDFIR